MFKDLNRPDGLYGEVYDRQTRAKDRVVGMVYTPFEPWEAQAVEIILEELNKKLNLHERTQNNTRSTLGGTDGLSSRKEDR